LLYYALAIRALLNIIELMSLLDQALRLDFHELIFKIEATDSLLGLLISRN